MKTIASNTIALAASKTSLEKAAATNGMTLDQMAAANYIQSPAIAANLPQEALAILRARETALEALTRVAAVEVLDETTEAHIARVTAAILG